MGKIDISVEPVETYADNDKFNYRIIDVPEAEDIGNDEIMELMDSFSSSEESEEYVMGYEAFLDGDDFESEENEEWIRGWKQAEVDSTTSTSKEEKSPKC